MNEFKRVYIRYLKIGDIILVEVGKKKEFELILHKTSYKGSESRFRLSVFNLSNQYYDHFSDFRNSNGKYYIL